MVDSSLMKYINSVGNMIVPGQGVDKVSLYENLLACCGNNYDICCPISSSTDSSGASAPIKERAIRLMRYAYLCDCAEQDSNISHNNGWRYNTLSSDRQLMQLYSEIYIQIFKYLGSEIGVKENIKAHSEYQGRHGQNGRKRAARLLFYLNKNFTIFLNEHIKLLAVYNNTMEYDNIGKDLAISICTFRSSCYADIIIILQQFVSLKGNFSVLRNNYGINAVSVVSDTSLLSLVMIGLQKFWDEECDVIRSPLIFQYLYFIIDGVCVEHRFPIRSRNIKSIELLGNKLGREKIKDRMRLKGKYLGRISMDRLLSKWINEDSKFLNGCLPTKTSHINRIILACPMSTWRMCDSAGAAFAFNKTFHVVCESNKEEAQLIREMMESKGAAARITRSPSFICTSEQSIKLEINTTYIYLIYQNKNGLDEPEMRIVKRIDPLTGKELEKYESQQGSKDINTRDGVRFHSTLAHFGAYNEKNFIEHGVDPDVCVLMGGEIVTSPNDPYKIEVDNGSGHFKPDVQSLKLYTDLITKKLGIRYQITWFGRDESGIKPLDKY